MEVSDAKIAQKFHVMRNTVFHHISKHREELKIRRVAQYFDDIWGVWKCGETRSWVFDISPIGTYKKTEEKKT